MDIDLNTIRTELMEARQKADDAHARLDAFVDKIHWRSFMFGAASTVAVLSAGGIGLVLGTL